jgi:hypothetical protein
MYRNICLDMGLFVWFPNAYLLIILTQLFFPNSPTNDDRELPNHRARRRELIRIRRPRANHSATEETTNTMLIYAVLLLLHSTGHARQKSRTGFKVIKKTTVIHILCFYYIVVGPLNKWASKKFITILFFQGTPQGTLRSLLQYPRPVSNHGQ